MRFSRGFRIMWKNEHRRYSPEGEGKEAFPLGETDRWIDGFEEDRDSIHVETRHRNIIPSNKELKIESTVSLYLDNAFETTERKRSLDMISASLQITLFVIFFSIWFELGFNMLYLLSLVAFIFIYREKKKMNETSAPNAMNLGIRDITERSDALKNMNRLEKCKTFDRFIELFAENLSDKKIREMIDLRNTLYSKRRLSYKNEIILKREIENVKNEAISKALDQLEIELKGEHSPLLKASMFDRMSRTSLRELG